MTYTIDLTRSEETRLQIAAKQNGMEPVEFIKQLVTEHLPIRAEMTFSEILSPIHKQTREQGYSDEEMGQFADSELAAYRAESRSQKELELI